MRYMDVPLILGKIIGGPPDGTCWARSKCLKSNGYRHVWEWADKEVNNKHSHTTTTHEKKNINKIRGVVV